MVASQRSSSRRESSSLAGMKSSGRGNSLVSVVLNGVSADGVSIAVGSAMVDSVFDGSVFDGSDDQNDEWRGVMTREKATAPERTVRRGLLRKRKRGGVMGANRLFEFGDRCGNRLGTVLVESNHSMPNAYQRDSITDRISVFLSLANRVVVVFPKVGAGGGNSGKS